MLTGEEADFYFIAPLGPAMLFWAGLGSLAGAFVSGLRDYWAGRAWETKRWVASLLCGYFGGLGVLLACDYGLINQSPAFPSGHGFAFPIGMVGGFLGCEALGRIADLILPAVAKPSRT